MRCRNAGLYEGYRSLVLQVTDEWSFKIESVMKIVAINVHVTCAHLLRCFLGFWFVGHAPPFHPLRACVAATQDARGMFPMVSFCRLSSL